MYKYKSNQAILEELSEQVAGHEEAKKALITLLHRSRIRHCQKYDKGMYDEYLLSPSKVLLIGASGTGKTHLVESLRKLVNFPLVRVDATDLNPVGSSGGIKTSDLESMILKEARRFLKAQPDENVDNLESAVDRTVVFIDEFDKLGCAFDSSGKWNTHVQSNFLTLFDNKLEFAGVSFIFAGAFTDLTTEDTNKKYLGFTADKDSEQEKRNLDEALVKMGLIPEIVGRLTNIVELDKFTEDDFYKILIERLYPKKEMDLAALGVFNVVLTEKRGREIARHAMKSGQGVRAIQRQLESEFLDAEFNCEIDNDGPLYLGFDEAEDTLDDYLDYEGL